MGTNNHTKKVAVMDRIAHLVQRIASTRGLLVALLLTISTIASAQPVQNPIFISSVSKTFAPANDTLTVSGRGFQDSPSGLRIFFGGAVMTPTTAQDGVITVAVPSGATLAPLRVVNVDENTSARATEPFFPSFGGSFDATKFAAPERITISTPPNTTLGADVPFYNLCACDFDGDGDIDIAGAANASRVEGKNLSIVRLYVFENTTANAGETPQFTTHTFEISSPTQHITCADLDNDGHIDLVATQGFAGGVTSRNKLFYLQNTGGGTSISFGDASAISIPNTENGDLRNIWRVSTEDLDNDGKIDLIVNNTNDNLVFVYQNTTQRGGNIGFATEPLSLEGTGRLEDKLSGLYVADIDGDTWSDILVAKTDAAIYVLRNTSTPGQMRFLPAQEVASNQGRGTIRGLAVGDVNQDGKQDIIATVRKKGIIVAQNLTENAEADLEFASVQLFEVPDPSGSNLFGLDVGDVDGDGRLDVLLSDVSANGTWVMHNGSTEERIIFTPHTPGGPANARWSRNGRVADVNKDGKPDLLLADASNGSNSADEGIWIITNTHCMTPKITPTEGIICNGVPFVVNATPGPGVSYKWTTRKGAVTLTRTPADPFEPFLDISFLGDAGIYTLTVEATLGACEVTSTSVNFERKDTNGGGTPVLTNSGSTCVGERARIVTTLPSGVDANAVIHRWTGPAGDLFEEKDLVLDNLRPKQAGEYIYYYVDGNGCASAPVNVLLAVVNLPELSILSDAPYGCTGTISVQLTSATYPGITSWQWKLEDNDLTSANSGGYTADQEGSYTLEYGDGACTSTTPVLEITSVEKPIIDPKSLPRRWCKSVAFTPRLSVAPSASARTVNLLTFSYKWDLGDGGPLIAEPTPSHTYATSKIYPLSVEVAYEGLSNCSATAAHSLEVIDTPSISLQRSPEKEPKCPTERITLTAPTITQSGTQLVSYLWTNGAQTNSITTNHPGTYVLTAQDDAGCIIEESADITNVTNSGITLSAVTYSFALDTLTVADLAEGSTVEVSVGRADSIVGWERAGRWKREVPEHLSQKWRDLTVGLDTTLSSRPLLTARYDELALGPSVYRVRALDMAGCLSEAFIKLTIKPDQLLEGYTIFSPDNDGVNDFWKIYKLDLVAVNDVQCVIKIFDRRGRLVFDKADIDANWSGWDGTNRGNPLPEDVYFYILQCPCQEDECPRASGYLLLSRGR